MTLFCHIEGDDPPTTLTTSDDGEIFWVDGTLQDAVIGDCREDGYMSMKPATQAVIVALTTCLAILVLLAGLITMGTP